MCFACIYVCVPFAYLLPIENRRGVRFPGLIACCKLPCEFCGKNLVPLEEVKVLLTDEECFYPCHTFFFDIWSLIVFFLLYLSIKIFKVKVHHFLSKWILTGLWIGTDLSWLEGLEFSTHPSWRGKGVEFELIIDGEVSIKKNSWGFWGAFGFLNIWRH